PRAGQPPARRRRRTPRRAARIAGALSGRISTTKRHEASNPTAPAPAERGPRIGSAGSIGAGADLCAKRPASPPHPPFGHLLPRGEKEERESFGQALLAFSPRGRR